MKSNQTLATLAIMGVLSSCSTVPPVTPEEINLSENSPIKGSVMKNYRRLASSTPLFSGDESKKLKALVRKIVAIPRGQELIASMRSIPDLEINVEDSETTNAVYRLSPAQQIISLNEKSLSAGDEESMLLSMMHEMLHHVQMEQGRALKSSYFSPEQSILVAKLSEAETFSWEDLLKSEIAFIKEHKGASYTNLKPLMQANLVAEGRQKAARSGKSFNEEAFKRTDALYLFQQALIQTGGNRAQAEKKAVGKRLALYMAPTAADTRISNWRYHYDFLSVVYTRDAANGMWLSSVGNPVALEKVLSFYAKTYSVDKSQINTAYLGKHAEKLREEVFAVMKKRDILSYGDRQVRRILAKHRKAAAKGYETSLR